MIKRFNSNKKEILKKGISVFFIRVLGYGFGFMFILIVANKFGAKIQGIFSIAFLFLSVGSMLAKLGVETAIVKWIANATSNQYKKTIYLKSLLLILMSSSLVGISLYFLAPSIASMYQKPDIQSSIRIAAIAIPFWSILDISGSYFKGELKINTYGFYFHFMKFFLPFTILYLIYFSSLLVKEIPIFSYLLGLIISSSIIVIHILFTLRKRHFSNLEISKSRSFKAMFFESYPMMISSAVVMIMGWSDVFILGFFVSEREIGIYSTAVKIATIVSFTYNAIATIVTPKIAAYFYNNKTKELKETISFSSKTMFLCGFPIFIAIFFFPEFFLSFFGKEYIEGKSVLRILIFSQLINIITGPVGPIFQMTGRQKLLQNFVIISLIVNLVLSLILVRFFSMNGVAFGSAIGMILWNILGAKYIWKVDEIKTWPQFIK